MSWRPLARAVLHRVGLLAWIRQMLGRAPDGTVLRRTNTVVNKPGAHKPEPEPVRQAPTAAEAAANDAYQAKLQAELKTFTSNINVHDLPQIYHYWSNKYLLPQHKPFGFTCPDSFYVKHIARILAARSSETVPLVSIGAGNCDTEVRLAKMLLAGGHSNFAFDCLDLNADMLKRGAALANKEGVSAHIRTVETDLNFWQPQKRYGAAIANQSLHHIEQLEKVFDAIAVAIGEDGVFLTSDMIGRNGHQRWPEAFAIVNTFWQELPASFRFNLQLQRHEPSFLDWDCSQQGFEGIRAQDILGLLIGRFHFESFFAFANAVDPFIDRGFGHHFSPDCEWDRAFIDRVHARDQEAMTAGEIKPTHLLAAMRVREVALQEFIPPFTPAFSWRDPAA